MKLVLDGIEMMLKKEEALAAFGRPVDERLTYSRERGFSTAIMEIQDRMPNQHMRGLHDLFLVHCAIFASTEQQLRQIAERVWMRLARKVRCHVTMAIFMPAPGAGC